MQLFQRGDTLVDIRTPVAQTLVEIYDDEPDECLASAISALLPIVIAELSHTAALMGEVQNS